MAIDKIVRNIVEDNAVTQPKIAAGAVDNAAVNTSIITGLTELTSVAENDQLIIHDTSAGTLKKVTKSNATTLGSPVFTSVSPDNSQTADGGNITFTITGSGFTAGTNARLISNTGVRLLFDSVTRTDTTTISAVIARSSLLVAQSPYDIQVINGEGLSVVGQNKIDIDTTPLFITGAGSLGSPVEGDTVDIEILARDPDSSSAITFEIQSGSLPAGLSLVNNSGDSCRIQGTAPTVSADTTSNFTLRAFDSASNATSRAFSITVINLNPVGVRFNSGSSDYLNVTQSSGTSDKIGTFSVWLKGTLGGGSKAIFSGHTDSNNRIALYFSDSLRIYGAISGSQSVYLITTQLFRDPSAWYHIVVAWDTSQGTDTNRFKVYVNGSQVTSFSTAAYPSQNADVYWSKGTDLTVGARFVSSITSHYDGYMAETVFIDGQQLDPTSFGKTNSNGVWIPIGVSSLTFGTNGFYLDFEDSADLGDDYSANANDFTENNLTSIDAVQDSPVNNFATLNALDNFYFGGTLSEGNLKVASDAGVESYITSTIAVSTGKWYWEIKVTASGSGRDQIGIADKVSDNTDFSPISGNARVEMYYGYTGNHYSPDTGNNSYGDSFGAGDIIGVALDLDNHKLYFSKNGTFQASGDPTSGATGTGAIAVATDPADGVYYAVFANIHNTASTFEANFGNPSFAISSGNTDGNSYGNFEYAPPAGYYSLNTKNLAEYG